LNRCQPVFLDVAADEVPRCFSQTFDDAFTKLLAAVANKKGGA